MTLDEHSAGRLEAAEEPRPEGWIVTAQAASWLVVAVLFGLALTVRLVALPHSRMIDEVQFRSALIARALYFEMIGGVPAWRREINAISVSRLARKEPSVLPLAAAAAYRMTGGERPVFGKLLSTLAWLAGGGFLFLILRDLVSPDGALYGLAYYLFVPAGIVISTSFTSDALMLAALLASIFAMLKYYAAPSAARLAVCCVTAGLAIFVKPLTVFVAPAVFVALAVATAEGRSRIPRRDVLIFLATAVPLGAAYYVNGILSDTLDRQAELSFVPSLLATPSYWAGWYATAAHAAGAGALVLAMVGAPLLRRGAPRAVLLAACAGYILLGLTFTYHIRFAEHYHLQLIVIAALGLSPICAWTVRHAAAAARSTPWAATPVLALVLLALHAASDLRHRFAAMPARESVEAAREVGELVRHSDRVVYVASYYGRPLEYLGELSGTYWPRADETRAAGGSAEDVATRLASLGFAPEYFAVTDLREFTRHHADLQGYLSERCSLLAGGAEYFVYGHCRH